MQAGKSQARDYMRVLREAKRNRGWNSVVAPAKTQSARGNVSRQLNDRARIGRYLLGKYIVRESTLRETRSSTGQKSLRIPSRLPLKIIIRRPPCSLQSVHYFGRDEKNRGATMYAPLRKKHSQFPVTEAGKSTEARREERAPERSPIV